MKNLATNYLLPIPYSLGPYGMNRKCPFNRIISSGESPNLEGKFYQQSLLKQKTKILEPIEYAVLPNSKPDIGHYLDSAIDLQKNTQELFSKIWENTDKIGIIGGDHTISIATGAGLAKVDELDKFGMIWIDAHGDFNTPKTSPSKSITGYPLALNCGFGAKELLKSFNGKKLKKVVHIGARDLDFGEKTLMDGANIKQFSSLEVETQGIKSIAMQTLEYLKDCEMLWISFDVDVLDNVFFEDGETDLPLPGGLTTREILTLIHLISQTNRQKILEIVQLNDIGKNTHLISFSSRLMEIFFGISNFRY